MGARVELDQRDVEGAAAQIVDQNASGGALAMAEFDGRGGRFVQQTEHGEAGAAEGVDGEESLVAVGVGGHAEHDFERLGFAEAREPARGGERRPGRA